MKELVELARRVFNLLREGTIDSVEGNRCRVSLGPNSVTAPLHWFELRAGNTRTWNPPTVGEQVMVFSPNGELTEGIVLVGINSNAHPSPSSNQAEHITIFPDGGTIIYNHETGALSAAIPGDASIQCANLSAIASNIASIQAETINLSATNINMDADNLNIDADIATTGALQNNGKNVGDTHAHSGVMSGPANTGPVT